MWNESPYRLFASDRTVLEGAQQSREEMAGFKQREADMASHKVQPELPHRLVGPIPGSVLAGMVGAMTATLGVVLAGSLTWVVVQSGLWMILGPGIAAIVGALCGRVLTGKAAAIPGGIGGAVGGLGGAFFAVASAEMYHGWDWTVSGGVFGVTAAALCGAFVALLAALVGVAFSGGRTPEEPARTAS
jgi:hypothetical protein